MMSAFFLLFYEMRIISTKIFFMNPSKQYLSPTKNEKKKKISTRNWFLYKFLYEIHLWRSLAYPKSTFFFKHWKHFKIVKKLMFLKTANRFKLSKINLVLIQSNQYLGIIKIYHSMFIMNFLYCVDLFIICRSTLWDNVLK